MQSISAIALALGILAGSQSDASDTATSSARMCPTTTSAWQFEPEWSARNIEAASATLSPDVLTVVPSRDELLRQQVGMRDRLTRLLPRSRLLWLTPVTVVLAGAARGARPAHG